MNLRLRTAAIAIVVLGFASNLCSAGWWHHHRHHGQYYAAPAYYQAPTYQAPAAPAAPQYFMMPSQQAAPSPDAIINMAERILDLARRRPFRPSPFDPSDEEDPSSLEGTLGDIRSELNSLSESVENANTQLQRHGNEIAILREDVEILKDRPAGSNSELNSRINDLATDVAKDLHELKERVRGSSRSVAEENFKALVGDTLDKVDMTLGGDKKLTPEQKAAITKDLEKMIEARVKKIYEE